MQKTRTSFRPSSGPLRLDDARFRLRVWAPLHDRLDLHIVAPSDRVIPMNREEDGYFTIEIDAVPGTRYFFRPAGQDRPDPASRYQPDGVHGPSEIVDPSFEWSDRGWKGLPIEKYVIYELHIGTFTREGTFDAAVGRLQELRELGITAIEIMPVAQFPGGRNWGYDGVFISAVQNTYGGPAGLKRLVDAAHSIGLAVVMDVVYNHLGPEGNYVGEYAPYFTDRYKTPWGLALNFDGPASDHVRRYFIDNALMWIDEFHVDGLRLDAVHAIVDHTAYPFLHQLTDEVHAHATSLGREVQIIAESDLNDPRLIHSPERGGWGMDAQWSDDFHHALHALLTREKSGYYVDFGRADDLVTVLRRGYRFAGEYSAYRQRTFGRAPEGLPGSKFVVCAQNHDQVGNRMKGDRLAELLPFERLKLAAAMVILSPFIPLIFMGEEYGEENPFQYFTSHGDEALIEAVRSGRREEFAAFGWEGDIPDPHDVATFERSRLDPEAARDGRRAQLREFYRELLALRSSHPALASFDLSAVDAFSDHEVVCFRRSNRDRACLAIANFGDGRTFECELTGGNWDKAIDSLDPRFGGMTDAPDGLCGGEKSMLNLGASQFLLYVRS